MKNLIKLFVIILSISIFSCEEVVDIPLDTAAPKLVIDANINWDKNTTGNNQQIKLTLTSGFYENTQPPANGAMVTITNSNNTVFTFTEDAQTGIYKCTNFVPVINQLYTLKIIYKGEIYTATANLFATPEIINTTQGLVSGFSGDVYEVTFFYQDNGAETNYYLQQINTNFELLPDFFANKDEFFNGNQMFEVYRNEDLKVGSVVTFTLYGISLPYFTYMRALASQSGTGGGNPFAAPPATLRGNVINTTNQSNFPLGYFRLSEVSEKSYTIQ